jgi:hypothetical protein
MAHPHELQIDGTPRVVLPSYRLGWWGQACSTESEHVMPIMRTGRSMPWHTVPHRVYFP